MSNQSVSLSTQGEADYDDVPSNWIHRKASEAPSLTHGSGTVDVYVGRGVKSKVWAVHRNLLTLHSEYFAAKLGLEDEEASKDIAWLTEDDPEAFEIFYNFLYNGLIFSRKAGDAQEVDDDIDIDSMDDEWLRLAAAWFMGEKYQSTTFKDAITDAVIAKMLNFGVYPVDLHELVYPKSTSTSAIRKLLVHVAIWEWKPGAIARRPVEEGTAQFFFDYAKALDVMKRTGVKGRAPYWGQNTCFYHEHGAESKPCYKTMFPGLNY